jgi:uncharacterized membrane protein
MPEDRNKSYDLHIDPDLLKIMPKPKVGADDAGRPRQLEPKEPCDSRIDRRSPDEIPEIDPETGEPDFPEKTDSHFLDIDPDLLEIMPKPVLGAETWLSVESPATEQCPVEEKAGKSDTLELMSKTAKMARLERELERGPLTSLGMPENTTALLAYVFGWVSGLIVLLAEKKNNFVRRHAAQSFVVCGVLSSLYFLVPFVLDVELRKSLIIAINTVIAGISGWLMYSAYRKRSADIRVIRAVVDAVLRLL